ncbi:MAG: 30S ribosomal protein S20 [Sphaerochaetaceae bacterium]|nr:30S ribosomal protein S20 [Sphaerochaetaceae bacterium]
MNSSAKKRDRQAKVQRMCNREKKSEVRTSVKKFDAACAAGDKAAAEAAMKESFKLLDSAATKGIYHSNTTDRKKSRMNVKLNKLA